MLKSTDDKHSNVYRIVKVLSNQDYLVVDQQQQHYVLAQNGIASSSKGKKDNNNELHQSTRIVSLT